MIGGAGGRYGRFVPPVGYPVTIGGNLRTEGNGVLTMTTGTVNVSGGAAFSGGSTNGHLTGGTLNVTGSFRQSGSASAFSPTGSHVTILSGTANDTISFANPGYGSSLSHFADLRIQDAGNTKSLLSDIYVEKLVQTPYGAPSRMITSANRAVYAKGMDLDYVVFDNTRLSVIDGTSTFQLHNSTFQNMDPAADQFTAARAYESGWIFQNMQFLTPAGSMTSGRYVVLDGLRGSLMLSIRSNLGTNPPAPLWSATNMAYLTWLVP